jgi:H-type lectin domain-containing protein
MAYTPVPAVAADDWIDEIFINTYWVDNMAASVPDVFSAKGQIAVGLGVDSMGVLNVGADGTFLQADSTQTLGMIWKALVWGRQGASATDWSIGGTSFNFTPASAKIQVGRTSLISTTTADGSYFKGTLTITFPVAFAQVPLVFATLSPTSLNANLITVEVSSPSTTQVTLTVYSHASISVAGVNWLAIGE